MYATQITESHHAATLIKKLIGDEVVESLLVLFLNSKNKIVGYDIVAKGSINLCAVSMADIFRPAIAIGAASIIVAHNHPSGEVVPSESDVRLSKKVDQASEILGIPVLDHIIVSDNDYVSFEDSPEEFEDIDE